jgi:NAD(P)-dependent dehydrogenase (short-subunit alcohol dehydrogenase family)
MPTVLVTGASQGIGAAIARAFASLHDAHLVLVSRNAARLRDVAEDCRQKGAQTRFFSTDLTREHDVTRMAEAVLDSVGPPDVLVNNAGQFLPGSVAETKPADFRAQVAVNLTSAFLVTNAFLTAMFRADKGGHIFFLASVASIKGYPQGAAYCASKHGVLGLARALREETRERGIRVTSVIPGATNTASWEGLDLPASRFIPPEDVARSILDIYRLSPQSVVEEILIRPQLGDL